MKRMIVILAAAALFPMYAYAGGKSHGTPSASLSVTSGSHSYSHSNSNAKAKSNAAASSGGQSSSFNNSEDAAASSAIAPGLVANGCMGSSAAAGQGMGFGVSLGTTWKDEDCIRIRKAQDLQKSGHEMAALAIRCQDPEVREAMKYEPLPCPQDVEAQEKANAPKALVPAQPTPAQPSDGEACVLGGWWCYKP